MKLIARPIDAVVVFIDRERPRPFKFRYTDSDGKAREITIEKVLSVTPQDIPGSKGFIYECQSSRGGTQFRYQLRYSLDTCRWLLYKI